VIDVRFTPDATKLLRSSEMTRCAKSNHSITSSASARSVCGNVKAARHADRAVEGELASGCA
jgi:hypothetical protein